MKGRFSQAPPLWGSRHRKEGVLLPYPPPPWDGGSCTDIGKGDEFSLGPHFPGIPEPEGVVSFRPATSQGAHLGRQVRGIVSLARSVPSVLLLPLRAPAAAAAAGPPSLEGSAHGRAPSGPAAAAEQLRYPRVHRPRPPAPARPLPPAAAAAAPTATGAASGQPEESGVGPGTGHAPACPASGRASEAAAEHHGIPSP